MNGAKNHPVGEIIPKKYFSKINICLILFFVGAAILSQVFLYFYTRTFLEFHYSSVLLKLSKIKHDILISSIVVNGLFFIIPCVFAVIFLIIYSHRVAGPMFRVKQYLKELTASSEGLRFRKTDALHSLATAINKVQKREQRDFDELSSNATKIHECLAQAKLDLAEGRDIGPVLTKIRGIHTANQDILDAVKL